MSLLANLLGQVTPGTYVPQNTGSYGTDTTSTYLSSNNRDLLALLKEYFQDDPKLSEKNGKLGFDVSGLTTDQISSLKTALQNSLDDLFGGSIQLSQESGFLGVDTTGLSDKDVNTLKSLLENLNSLGASLTKDQKAIVAEAITEILTSPSLFINASGHTVTGSSSSGSTGGQIPIPPPTTPPPTPSQYAFLAGKLGYESGALTIRSVQTTNTALGQIQAEEAKQLMDKIIQQVKDQQAAAEKAQISKIFGWVVNSILAILAVVLIVVGAVASIAGGAGIPLIVAGVGLLVGAAVGFVLTSPAGDELISALTTSLEHVGLDKTSAAILAVIIVVAISIVVSLGASLIAIPFTGGASVAAPIAEGVAEGVEASVEVATVATEVAATAVSTSARVASVAIKAGEFIQDAVKLLNLVSAGGNIGLGVASGVSQLNLADAEKQYLLSVARSKQIANTLNLLIKTIQTTLDDINSSISNSASVIGQVPTIASSGGTA